MKLLCFDRWTLALGTLSVHLVYFHWILRHDCIVPQEERTCNDWFVLVQSSLVFRFCFYITLLQKRKFQRKIQTTLNIESMHGCTRRRIFYSAVLKLCKILHNCMKLSCTLKHMRLKIRYTITVVSRNFKTFVSLSEYIRDCFTLI